MIQQIDNNKNHNLENRLEKFYNQINKNNTKFNISNDNYRNKNFFYCIIIF